MSSRMRLDKVLFLLAVALVFFGVVMVFSSSYFSAELVYRKQPWYFLLRQGIAAALGLLCMVAFSQVDYRRFHSPGWAFAGISGILILLIVAYFADPVAHRWVRIGPVQFQPSEFAKPALVVFLAWFVSARAPAVNHPSTFGPAALVLSLLGGFVVVADLGTAVVLVVTAAVILFVAGINRRYARAALAAGALCVVLAIAAKPLRVNRVITFVDPKYEYLSLVDPGGVIRRYATNSTAPRDPEYQARQSRIAVATGGLLGAGLMNAKQKFLYLPEGHTDFIFAIVAEELGLLRTLLLLAGFMLILWRGYRLYWLADNDFGRFLAIGLTTSIVFQALMNMTVVVGLAPTKGIPLPFISYGGSSLVSTLVCVGLLLSISATIPSEEREQAGETASCEAAA